ncbi:MAG: sulfide:quinone reductase [Leptonema illini]|jgi:sulfide:quinone oxidoreductase|uniref:Sulfide:quinone reductase n=1 Tax=Leptonema illini TaxID=183 RepID=A0A833H0X5_9LEPT|nr:MAG: sulfide:quinone reductase [Leptonema illini]
MKKRVLIAGGGIAGVEAAIQLRRAGMPVTLISNRPSLFVYPLSIWVPTGERTIEDVSIDLKRLAERHGFDLVIDEVAEIQIKKKQLRLTTAGWTGYDYLIVGLGAGKRPVKGMDEHTFSICASPDQHDRIRERLVEIIETGSGRIAVGFGGNPDDPSAVRGGPAFELMFNIDHLLRKKGVRDRFELTFFAPMPSPGARMGPDALTALGKFFKRLNIRRHFGVKITEFKENGIAFEDGSFIESDLIIYIPGLAGHPILKKSDIPLNKAGFVQINDYCEVMHNFDDTLDAYNVFAIGDTAALDGPDWRAKQGHIAEAMAQAAVYNILAMERGSTHRRGYFEHLNIICLMDSGNGAALVFRSDRRAFFLPLPFIGHAVKRLWGFYYRNTKLKRIPRLPGM